MDKFTHLLQAALQTVKPTKAQAEAGNYRKGRLTLHGLGIAIETPRGQYREGIGEDGKPWSNMMKAHYGHFEKFKGNDGDGMDVFIGEHPESQNVWIINQRNNKYEFDEHKVMLGFLNEDDAIFAYKKSYDNGWNGLKTIVPCTIEQLVEWLKHGNEKLPVTENSFIKNSGENMTDAAFDALISIDKEELLLDSCTVNDIVENSECGDALDALVVQYAKVPRKMNQMLGIMKIVSGDKVKPVSVQVTEPFKSKGTTNVAAVFELSDGQTISVFFHNNDITPNKILPTDDLVSWKWLLNKKDVTILVAPERGQDLSVREVARRTLKLAEKNSDRFQKANIDKANRMALIATGKATIAQKEAELAALNDEITQIIARKSQPVIEPLIEIPPVVELPINQEIVNASEELVPEFTEISKSFDEYVNGSNGDLFAGAKQFFKSELKNKYIKTEIGNVLLHGGTFSEMKRGMKEDAIKAKLVPLIPMILKTGIYKGEEKDTKGSGKFKSFHFFEKDNVEIGDISIDAGVTIGERLDNTLVCEMNLTAYGLGHSLEERWQKKIGVAPDSVKSRVEQPQLQNSDTALDSTIGEDESEINIIILKVIDNKTGKRLYELEDDVGQDGHEKAQTKEGIINELVTTYGWELQNEKIANIEKNGKTFRVDVFSGDGSDGLIYLERLSIANVEWDKYPTGYDISKDTGIAQKLNDEMLAIANQPMPELIASENIVTEDSEIINQALQQEKSDIEFIQSVVDGVANLSDEYTTKNLARIARQYPDNKQITELLNQSKPTVKKFLSEELAKKMAQ